MFLSILFFLIGGIFLGIGVYSLYKPGKLKKQCTQVTEGTIIGYNSKDTGGADIVHDSDSNLDDVDLGIRRPVTQYSVNGETFTAIGPEYMCYSDIHLQEYPDEQGTVEFRDGAIYAHLVRDKWMVHKLNPYEKLFPTGTMVTVHYDPENPSVSYVNEINMTEKKLIGRIFSLVGLGLIAVAIIVLFVG
jgi:hypothetical protein